jgi:phenylalanyl-tRNA synthetase beta chain
MKLSLNWLKDYIDPKLSTDELIERLTMAGLEVEAVESVGRDTVLEIEVTPNRPDCLNMLGLAREIGAITGRSVKPPKVKNHKTALLKNLIHIENKKDCSRYVGTLIREVQIQDAPAQMKQRLASLGIPAIHNAVDITNFVLMETGQPLHAFDYDKLAGGKIVVRRAKAGESIITIDGIERKLDPSILVIADAQKPVAIAGIMGGQDTQITQATKNILLESAHFDMGLIRRASRTLGLRSDSSYRFERNVNFDGVLTGANRATDLLLSLSGGRLSGRGEVAAQGQSVATKVKVKSSDIESLLGVEVTPLKVKTWLSRLGFKVKAAGGILTVSAPPDRADIQQDVDVIEEIARMIGFDRLPLKLPMIKSVNIPVDKGPREVKKQIRLGLTAAGCDEIITHAMMSAKALAKCGSIDKTVLRIFNPLNCDQELMRPAMMASLLQVALTNIHRGQKDLRFFEIGKCYFPDGEKETLAILLTGRRCGDWRLNRKDMVEIFDLKLALEGVFQKTGLSAVYAAIQAEAFDGACTAAVSVGGKQVGVLGKIERKVLNNWDIKTQDVYFAQIYLEERDVSLAVKKETTYKQIEEVCLRHTENLLKSVQFMEQYLGDKIQPGYQGLVFSCHYQSQTKTLREDEVSALHERIVQSLINELSAIRR